MTGSPLRNPALDLVRGVAILTMFWANLAGNVLVQPHPLWFRLIGTFAASLFVLISGYLAGWLQAQKGRPASYYGKRGLIILAVACFMEAEAGLVPGFSVDILYLIGLSTLIVPFFLRMNLPVRMILTGVVLALTPSVQKLLGYQETPDYLERSMISHLRDPAVAGRLIRQWIVDGYFPIFPWTGIFFLGTLLDPLRVRYDEAPRSDRLRIFAFLMIGLAGSVAVWKSFPGNLYVRENYSEMFYPPTIGYVMTACFVACVLYGLMHSLRDQAVLRPLAVLGSASLPLYVLHYVFIERFFNPRFTGAEREPLAHMSEFFVLYAILTAVMWGVSYLLRLLRGQDFWKKMPLVFRVVLGS